MLRKSKQSTNNRRITALFPDYCGVTVPVNIAPLNFGFADFEGNMHVSIQGNKGEALLRQQAANRFVLIRRSGKTC
jgi:hypothetical protein